MFASIIPDSSAKALSKYTEMVDDIIRTQAEKLQQGSELARVTQKDMVLLDSILDLEGHSVLPTPLWEYMEAVQISVGPAGLDGELQQLRDLRRVVITYKIISNRDFKITLSRSTPSFKGNAIRGRLKKLLLILDCSQIRALEASSHKPKL
ncbi:ALIX V-shaped domain-containing protein [Artemisia annua]|uniref:ALIX V-shaped domain-containing protein n=1 Tax=Artemisia annua TaxID=35608 RepID=A0A2U1KHL1_ARTAN|nr:ALIX V-shaped domain-containing protein [Artemisia annua]